MSHGPPACAAAATTPRTGAGVSRPPGPRGAPRKMEGARSPADGPRPSGLRSRRNHDEDEDEDQPTPVGTKLREQTTRGRALVFGLLLGGSGDRLDATHSHRYPRPSSVAP